MAWDGMMSLFTLPCGSVIRIFDCDCDWWQYYIILWAAYEPSPSPGVYFCYPACISHVSRLYLYLTVILGIPLYPCIDHYLAILQQIHCIPLYFTVSSCIRTFLAVSSCIPLYPAAAASKTGYDQKYTPGEDSYACALSLATATDLSLWLVCVCSFCHIKEDPGYTHQQIKAYQQINIYT